MPYDKVIIVDPGFRVSYGHHLQWNQLIQQGLDKRGVANSVFSSTKLPADTRDHFHDIHAVFNHEPRTYIPEGPGFNPDLVLDNLATAYQQELYHHMRKRVTSNSLLFCHTITSPATLLGIAKWYETLWDKPYLIANVLFLFEYPTLWTIKAFQKATLILEKYKKAILTSREESILELLKAISVGNIVILPTPLSLPVNQFGSWSSVREKKLTFGLPALTRADKNPGIVLQAIEKYFERNGQGDFFIQAFVPTNDTALYSKIHGQINLLANKYPSRFTIYPAIIETSQDFYQMLAACSVIILIYQPHIFHYYRPSQVFYEAAALGIPTLVSGGGWFEDQVRNLHNGGFVLNSLDAESVVNAFFQIETSYEERLAAARSAATHMRNFDNEDCFFKVILEKIPSIAKREPDHHIFDDAFFRNLVTSGDVELSVERCNYRRRVYVEQRFNYIYYCLTHAKDIYASPDFYKDLFEINRKNNGKTDYSFFVTKDERRHLKWCFSRLPRVTPSLYHGSVEEKKKVLIGTSIGPKRIEDQQAAISTWTSQGFQVISVNYEDEISCLQSLFPFVEFVPNLRNGQKECGKKRIFISDVLQALQSKKNDYDLFGLVNSDISLLSISMKKLTAICESAVFVSNRIDIPINRTYLFGYDAFFFSHKTLALIAAQNTQYM